MKLRNKAKKIVVGAGAFVLAVPAFAADGAGAVGQYFSAIDLGSVATAVTGVGVTVVGIAMAIKGISLAKRVVNKA